MRRLNGDMHCIEPCEATNCPASTPSQRLSRPSAGAVRKPPLLSLGCYNESGEYSYPLVN